MSIDKLIIPVTAVQEHIVPYGALLLYGTLRALSGGKDSFELSCITEDVADWFNVSVSTINAWFGSLIDAAYILISNKRNNITNGVSISRNFNLEGR